MSFGVADSAGAAAALALAGALASIPLYLLSTRGMPRDGEAKRGSRPVLDTYFHLAIAILSISLLGFMPLARDPLARLEPFASSRPLLEWTCAAINLIAILPLLAILGNAARRGAHGDPGSAPPLSSGMAVGLRRFLLGLTPLLTLEACILAGARALGKPAPAQSILVDFYAGAWSVRLPLAFLLVVAAPIVEETLFRGTLHPALSRMVGPPISCLATAALFGALHGEYAGVPTGLFGFFLARVRDVDGRLLPCVAIHGLYNALMLTLYCTVPWIRDLYLPI